MRKRDGKREGNIGEVETLAALVRLGVPVYIPFGDAESADMVAEIGGRLQRIQCKTSAKVSTTGTSIVFRTSHQVFGEDGRRHDRPYRRDEVDWFALYDRTHGELYLVPWSMAGTRNISIAVAPGAARKSHMHYAEDYRLEDVVRRLNKAE